MIALASLAAFLVCVGIVYRLLHGLRALEPGTEEHMPRVSVVCAARNEAHNVHALLSSLVAQSYPRELLEIIIVDDRSTDGTAALVGKWRSLHPYVQTVQVHEVPSGAAPKKNALAQGIAMATGELVLLTDADCQPPFRWVEEMASYFAPKVGLVAGFAPLRGKGVLAAVVKVDTLASAITAAGGIGLGKPTTCTGRNLAFRRRVYDEVGGYQRVMSSTSGDDDLFLHAVSQRGRWQVRYALSPDTFVPSVAPATCKELFLQRRRHLSAGRFYPLSVKARYALFHLCNLWLFVAPLAAAAVGGPVALCSLLLLLKVLVDARALYTAGTVFRHGISWWAFLLWQCYFLLTNMLLGPLSWVGRIRWRG
ncbi:MAG: glycosyltransferase [Candidatus Oleimicrobiaceae bacterium]